MTCIPKIKIVLILLLTVLIHAGLVINKASADNNSTNNISRKIPPNANVLVIPFSWNDESTPPYNIKQIYYNMFSTRNKKSFANVINKLTWGNQSVHGDILPTQKISTSYERTTENCIALSDDVENYVKNIREVYSQYDEYVVLGTFPCWWAGLTFHMNNMIYLSGKKITPRVMTHEFLHAMGLFHSSSLMCTSNNLTNCNHAEYGDPFSIMGYESDESFVGLTSYERYMLGYQKSNLLNWSPDITKYHLYKPQINSTKPTLLQIPIDNNNFFINDQKQRIGNKQISYYVEYTKPKILRNEYYAKISKTSAVTIRIGQRTINNIPPQEITMNSFLLDKTLDYKSQRCWHTNALGNGNKVIDATNHLIIEVTAMRKDKNIVSVTKTPTDFNFKQYIKNHCERRKGI